MIGVLKIIIADILHKKIHGKKCWCILPDFQNPSFSERPLLHHSSTPLLRQHSDLGVHYRPFSERLQSHVIWAWILYLRAFTARNLVRDRRVLGGKLPPSECRLSLLGRDACTGDAVFIIALEARMALPLQMFHRFCKGNARNPSDQSSLRGINPEWTTSLVPRKPFYQWKWMPDGDFLVASFRCLQGIELMVIVYVISLHVGSHVANPFFPFSGRI